MVQKALIKDWMRDEFAEGKLDNIPAEAITLLEEEAAATKSNTLTQPASKKDADTVEKK